jgi:tRNA-specific adenosine deaminase 3
MELYVTHEPCVMCSMAILHSRFGRVVIGRGMGGTGGMMAERRRDDCNDCNDCNEHGGGEEGCGGDEAGLRYGLFWRGELNWKVLCWLWKAEGEEDREEDGSVELDAAVQV